MQLKESNEFDSLMFDLGLKSINKNVDNLIFIRHNHDNYPISKNS